MNERVATRTRVPSPQLVAAETPANLPAEVVTRLPVSDNASAPPLFAMIETAVSAGNLDLVDRLMSLQQRWEEHEAKKAFVRALAAAKAEIKPIMRNRNVRFEGRNGGTKTDYWHEDLAAIAEAVDPILAKNGLFYNWRISNADGRMTVTCVLSHDLGYFEDSNSLSAPADCSGNKNGIQGLSSSATYLQRYTLKAALGLSVAGDDDGRAAADPALDAPANQNGKRSRVPSPTAAQSEPEAAAARQQPQPTGPRAIPTKGEKLDTWTAKYIAGVKSAQTSDELDDWDRLNDACLQEIFAKGKSLYEQITAATEARRGEIEDSENNFGSGAASASRPAATEAAPPAQDEDPAPEVAAHAIERMPVGAASWKARVALMEEIGKLIETQAAVKAFDQWVVKAEKRIAVLPERYEDEVRREIVSARSSL